MIPGGYRSPVEREQALDRSGAELHVLGTSIEGRPIRAARVPSRTPGAPALLVCAGIHGPEYIGVATALAFLERACGELRDRAEIWVLPCLNPDGYERTWARGGEGDLPELRANAHGVDLNRNYPLPQPQRRVWFTFGGWRTGSDDPKNPFFRGGAPASEPETAALVGLANRVRFHASLSLHSSMGTLIPPCVTDPASVATYRALCAAFREAQPRTRYRRAVAGRFDIFTGEQEDWQHHAHGTWAMCVEHYPVWVDAGRFLRKNLFRRFNPPHPERWIDNDLPGMLAYFHAALDLPAP